MQNIAKNIIYSIVLVTLCAVCFAGPDKHNQLPEGFDVFPVKTKYKGDPEVPFYVRIPSQYKSGERGQLHRVLLICKYLGGNGFVVARGGSHNEALINLADQRGWFVVSPHFVGHGEEVQDRTKCYYYPEAYSGQATLDALDLIAKKYPINTDQIFAVGQSGGAQFVHRFANDVPDRVVAVAVNSCSWYDRPRPQSKGVGWLLTIGEADETIIDCLDFADQLRGVGAMPILRSYLGMGHNWDERAMALDVAFFTYWDEMTKGSLNRPRTAREKAEGMLGQQPKDMPFVGDTEEWKYVPNTPENLAKVPEENRVYLPDETLAKQWQVSGVGTETAGEKIP